MSVQTQIVVGGGERTTIQQINGSPTTIIIGDRRTTVRETPARTTITTTESRTSVRASGLAGPAGPAGSNGAPGATGPQGPQGPPGDAAPVEDLAFNYTSGRLTSVVGDSNTTTLVYDGDTLESVTNSSTGITRTLIYTDGVLTGITVA